jgi:uncharacterized protein YuzE
MTVRIGAHEFDRVSYDERGDVLYLGRADAEPAAVTDATPEGHAVQLDARGELIGLTVVNARWLIARDGKLVITIPERIEAPASEFEPALSS